MINGDIPGEEKRYNFYWFRKNLW